MSFQLTSTAFEEGQPIPLDYTGEGRNASPPLKWTDPPAGTRSLALICEDPDAPHGTFTHWVVFDMDPKVVDLGEDHAPENARQGSNDWGQVEYGGPKPPSGEHRYFFHLYALDTKLNLPRGSTRLQVEQAMQGHVLDRAELIGRYASAQAQPIGSH